MTLRSGIVTGGTWCVDINKLIDAWPDEETASQIYQVDRAGGGSACNLAFDIKKLDPTLPVETIGLVGDDSDGRFLIAECDARNVVRAQLHVHPAATNFSDAYSARGSGRRTHLFFPGTSDFLAPDHFDFSQTNGRILHLGLPGVHKTMDRPWGGHANGWVATLAKARAAGLVTNLELVGIDSERLASLALPCLPYLDMLVVNDREIGALSGEATVRDGETDIAAVIGSARAIFERGAMSVVVVHFPRGAVAVTRSGVVTKGSVRIPPAEVVGANGAGDAFASGFVYGFHERWDVSRCLALAHAAAAASMRHISTSESVESWQRCLELAESWGWREF
jgi:sugar/nucleoside kinase (ribokinase family)